MKVKIDTKEKMHVITVEDEKLAANMAEDLRLFLMTYLQASIKNIIINFENVKEIDRDVSQALLAVQKAFQDNKNSMVICNLREQVEMSLKEQDFLKVLNITPTESEAWDMVQLEEMERELFD